MDITEQNEQSQTSSHAQKNKTSKCIKERVLLQSSIGYLQDSNLTTVNCLIGFNRTQNSFRKNAKKKLLARIKLILNTYNKHFHIYHQKSNLKNAEFYFTDTVVKSIVRKEKKKKN